MNRIKLITLATATALAANAWATPSDLRDLVDERASSGERELEDRGYDFVKVLEVGNGKIQYWYNDRRDQCVAINVNDGRYSAITEQPESICEGSSSSSGSYSRYDDDDDDDRYSSHGGGDPEDVVGMRASSGEQELESMGYRFVNSSKGDDRIWSNWWNDREDKCITVVTMDGRYDSVTDTLPFDCERDTGSSSGHGKSVTLYRDTEFRGTSIELDSDESYLGDTRIGNDELSSIRIPRGCAVILYEDANFRGSSLELNEDERELGRTRIGNDEASSIEVSCR